MAWSPCPSQLIKWILAYLIEMAIVPQYGRPGGAVVPPHGPPGDAEHLGPEDGDEAPPAPACGPLEAKTDAVEPRRSR